MRKAIKRLVTCLPTPVVYHIHKMFHTLTGKRVDPVQLAYLRSWPDPLRVVAGPFKGLTFTRETYSSALVPSLLGTYERELHDAVEWMCAYKPDLVVDIGAAEGYYAVGMALRNPEARSIAFEMFKPANHILGLVARANGIGPRLKRRGACTPRTLQLALQGAKRAVVICDCEGAEDFLLDPQAVPELKRAVVLVELHDNMNPGVSGRVRARFAGTHNIEVYRTQERTIEDLPTGYSMSADEFESLIGEKRGVVQEFFLFKPRT